MACVRFVLRGISVYVSNFDSADMSTRWSISGLVTILQVVIRGYVSPLMPNNFEAGICNLLEQVRRRFDIHTEVNNLQVCLRSQLCFRTEIVEQDSEQSRNMSVSDLLCCGSSFHILDVHSESPCSAPNSYSHTHYCLGVAWINPWPISNPEEPPLS